MLCYLFIYSRAAAEVPAFYGVEAVTPSKSSTSNQLESSSFRTHAERFSGPFSLYANKGARWAACVRA